MKKTFSLILLAALLVSFSASAANEPFTLRNGYTWGMTRDEAFSLAESEGLILITPGQGYLQYINVPVGGYSAEMSLEFLEASDEVWRLGCITYTFGIVNGKPYDPGNEEMFSALLDGLTETYGEPAEDGMGESGREITWILPDTRITLTRLIIGIPAFCEIKYRNEVTTPAETKISIPNSGF